MSLQQRILNRCLKHMATHKNKHGEIGPDFIVGDKADPYLRRWILTPRWLMPLCAIYAHEFCKDDDDVPHDHPYLFNVSWILRIGYFEHQFNRLSRLMARRGILPDFRSDLQKYWRPEGTVIWRWGWTAHRVQLKVFQVAAMTPEMNSYIHGSTIPQQMVSLRPKPITLFFCGPRVREWGFHCPQGWRHWKEYIAPTSYGNRVGKGCGE